MLEGYGKESVRKINRWFREKNLDISPGLICPGDL